MRICVNCFKTMSIIHFKFLWWMLEICFIHLFFNAIFCRLTVCIQYLLWTIHWNLISLQCVTTICCIIQICQPIWSAIENVHCGLLFGSTIRMESAKGKVFFYFEFSPLHLCTGYRKVSIILQKCSCFTEALVFTRLSLDLHVFHWIWYCTEFAIVFLFVLFR